MSCSPRNRLIASNLALITGEIVRNPLLEIDSRGTILAVNSWQQADSIAHCEFYSGLLVAGFVNAHCHLELSHLKGQMSEGVGLAAFASTIGKRRAESDPTTIRAAIAAADRAMRREGIVAVIDITNNSSTAEVKRASDIHYLSLEEHFGLRDGLDVCHWIEGSPTPHSTYSVGEELLYKLSHTESKAPLSIHFMESPDELALFAGRGAIYEWYAAANFECDFLHHGSPAARIVASIPPTRSTIFVHNCCLREQDLNIINDHFTAPIYWALSPRSNHFISRLSPPVELLRKAGANICIGTDSLASNHSLSIIEELRMIEGVPLAERLDWATRQGARAIGEPQLGDLVVGKTPGINLISGLDYERLDLGERSRVEVLV